MSFDFAPPADPSGGVDFKALNGSLLLVKVLAVEDHVPTVHTRPGEKSPAVRADVTVLDGPGAGQEHPDALIFPKVLQSQLRARVGGYVLGRLGQGAAKAGQSPPWTLTAASDADTAKAHAHMMARPAPTPPAGPTGGGAGPSPYGGTAQSDEPPF